MGNCCTPGESAKGKPLITIAQAKHEAMSHDDKYRKSSNTSFYCRQNENIAKCNYFIDPQTIHIESNKEFRAVLCDLCDAKNDEKQLQLSVTRVIGDVVRVSVKERNNDTNKKQRYEVNSNDDVLTTAARVPLAFSKVETEENCAILSWDHFCLKIFYSPFTMYIYESDELQILMNNKNKFYFEAYSGSQSTQISSLGHTYYQDYDHTSIGLDFDFVESNDNEDNINVYGIPSHATSLSLPSTNGFKENEAYRMYNLDVYKYKLNVPSALYGSIPYIIHHNSSNTNSILWCNASETFVEIDDDSVDEYKSKNVGFRSKTGALEAFVLLHKNGANKSYLSQYYALSGYPQLPPLFALAHHQCRWNYNDEKDVMDINDKFDEYSIPNDVIWLDIEHTDGKKYFTWDTRKFPDPKRLITRLSNDETKRKLVCIVDPHIKKDFSYYIFNEINKNDYWVKTRDGNNFEGNCWPGTSLYPDFINPKMRQLWSKQFHVYNPNIFVWNDMNEPSVFNAHESTMPLSNKHNDGIHHDLRHDEIHNLYGYYHHKASFEGLLKRNDDYKMNQRPFLLSRSFFIGSQKYGAIWTGDNKANWKHLKMSISMLLSLSVAGMPFVGADVGGFFGNCSAVLMQRWYNLAVYYPFFRNHSHHNTRRQEFWMFDADKECMESMKHSIIERYKLLPYIYTLFYLSHCEAHPIMRPLWYEFETDVNTFDRDDAFMFGDALFVAPIVTKDTDQVTVALPHKQNTVYYEMRDTEDSCTVNVYGMNETVVDLVDYRFETPVLRIGGKMTVEKHKYIRRSSALMKDDPITIVVSLDCNGYSASKHYLDDGETLNHLDSDEYVLSEFIFENNIFKNQIIHSNAAIKDCNIYQIWVLMALPKQVPIETVTVNSQQSKSIKKLLQCDYKTPHLLIIDNVDIYINGNFQILFQ